MGLKRPNYLHEPNVPERLAYHLPDLKPIVALRDPIECAISAYFHQMRQNFAPVRNESTGLRAILHGEWDETYPRTSQIVEYGFYYEQLTRYLQHFDQDQFFVPTYQSD
ncbi:sulfotransferase domain-containing protein [Salinibacter ruber]|uniref:sulfotransferase domain-containing protein n=1 Tax=Salinibacter ruber TaxID=146919 RepID=UPI003C6DD6EE